MARKKKGESRKQDGRTAKKKKGESRRIRLHKAADDIEEALRDEAELHIAEPGSGEPGKPVRHVTKSFRRGEIRSRCYSGDAPLDRVVYDTATVELGRLHDMFDSLSLVGDRAVIDLLEFEHEGTKYPLEDCHTAEYGFVVRKSTVTAVPVPGQGSEMPEIVGGLIATNPVTGEPFTEDEQRALKNIKVQLGKYSAKESDSSKKPKKSQPSVQVVENSKKRRDFGVGRDAVVVYKGNQSLAYVIKELAEMNFGRRVDERRGSKIACRVLEMEHDGETYHLERSSPTFKLVRRVGGGMWAEPVNGDVSKYMTLGEMFTEIPGRDGELSPVEQGRLRIKVRMYSCTRTTTRSLRTGRMPFEDNPSDSGEYRK